MALWSDGSTYNSGVLWSPAIPSPGGSSRQNNRIHNHKNMLRQDFYPSILSARPEWHTHLALKLPELGPGLPLTVAQINNGIADNLYMAYALGPWLTNIRELGPAATACVKDLAAGTGGDLFAFTPYNLPAMPVLPAGIDPMLPGALDRIFGLVKIIKGSPGYTLTKGLDMGIVGSEAPAPPPGTISPRITVTAISGVSHQYARVKFIKDGHEYVIIESRRGGGNWEDLGMTKTSPFTDMRPLLVAGQAEIREYRARFFDNSQPNGEYSDIARVTLSPAG